MFLDPVVQISASVASAWSSTPDWARRGRGGARRQEEGIRIEYDNLDEDEDEDEDADGDADGEKEGESAEGGYGNGGGGADGEDGASGVEASA